jgi:hypothetical protein
LKDRIFRGGLFSPLLHLKSTGSPASCVPEFYKNMPLLIGASILS